MKPNNKVFIESREQVGSRETRSKVLLGFATLNPTCRAIYILRTGNKIAVTRIELNSDQNELIAVGTGSYVVA